MAAYQLLRDDPEIAALQDYSNIVSIKRLGFNDHGPVHMRKVTYNAVKMATFLQARGIPLSLEKEEVGSFDDSLTAVIMAAFLHDVGMSIGRSFHENTGIWLAQPIIERLLVQLYPSSLAKRVILRSLAMECVMGHMATIHIHSLEAGLILVADGCDMEKGRGPNSHDAEHRRQTGRHPQVFGRGRCRRSILSQGRGPRSGSTFI